MNVYGQILRAPHIAALIGAALLTRLPLAINGLAVLLFLREETGSFGIAGLVVGALALGSALGAPFGSRLMDRRGARMLIPLAVVHASSVLAIWALGEAGAPTAALIAVALLAGASLPTAGAVLRSRYTDLLDDERLVHGAYALDSVTIEIAFVSGPLLTAIAVALVGPAPALGLSAVLVLAGAILFSASLPGSGEPHPAAADHRGALGPLRDPAIMMVALSTVPVGFCLGTIEVSIPAFAAGEGGSVLAGVLLAAWSGASGIGGLIYGARASTRPRFDSFLAIAVCFPLACLPVALAWSPASMFALVLLAGAPIAPLIASRNLLVGALAPHGTGAESFTWLMTALVVGLSAGNAIGGAVIEAEGWPAAVLAGCAVAAIGAAFTFGFRGSLRPRLATG
ncbi:MAG: MFS transporter [Solirubrobacterales bacterium]